MADCRSIRASLYGSSEGELEREFVPNADGNGIQGASQLNIRIKNTIYFTYYPMLPCSSASATKPWVI